ncbi:MAG: hypothetical protein WAM14_05340 [Candidatus Nitrosopolaris sp.]
MWISEQRKIQKDPIGSSPTEKFHILILSTRIRDTPFKNKFASLVKITDPMGKFVLPDEHSSKSIVFLSGGIGVTPFRSMVKYLQIRNYL